ncbi:ubiquitin-related domain-containing protein [Filobasidium floriforme]|uniref:ubiquitin-related domain-containing protein n=1 Tax=Filobasidium floriforme TaxID=5210 RepID=UPI001E8CED84|nr:ubiquitin-related domain-containing protein [Filobasidium floriforme]KAH8090908.1 ubiquitin-related domain-containing protein [Filobasidium floriforme]
MSEENNEAPPTAPPAGEVKPEQQSMNIKVTSTDGNEVFFKIKRTTRLNKLKNAYAERVGKNVAAIRFFYDGNRVNDDDTPDSLDLEEGDSIEVALEQVGGC